MTTPGLPTDEQTRDAIRSAYLNATSFRGATAGTTARSTAGRLVTGPHGERIIGRLAHAPEPEPVPALAGTLF